MGALERPPIRYELRNYLSWYDDMDRRGGAHILVLLMHGETVAGMSEASWDARTPCLLYTSRLCCTCVLSRRRSVLSILQRAPTLSPDPVQARLEAALVLR